MFTPHCLDLSNDQGDVIIARTQKRNLRRGIYEVNDERSNAEEKH